jgi:hypothetical protein
MTVKVEDEFEVIGDAAVDDRQRVTLAKVLKRLHEDFGGEVLNHFRVLYSQAAGLIVLEPATTIPLREAWLYKNPEALKMVRAGIEAAGRGEVVKRESFAKHADDEIE